MNSASLHPDTALNIAPATESAVALHSLLHGSALYTLEGSAWIRVTGEDRVRWLNGMATNSIQDLAAGSGGYNYFLSAQGRIEGDGYIFNTGDALLIETAAAQREHLIAWLDHYIIMDDVELTAFDAMAGIGIAGPVAKSLIEATLPDVVLAAPIGITAPFHWRNAEVSVIAAHSPLVPRYELWTTPEHFEQLQQALNANGGANAGGDAVEWLRLLEGTPRYGTDIRNNAERHELAQETAQMRALHFAKGCYLGQEIVERIRSRGNVHRTFSGFLVEGNAPVAGSAINAEEKEVGEITSAAHIPLGENGITVALGYIRREALDRKAELSCNGIAIKPVALPITNI